MGDRIGSDPRRIDFRRRALMDGHRITELQRNRLADMETYEQSELHKEFIALLQPFFAGEYKTYRCEVKYTDMVL
jgi:hypothetical protein